VVRLCISSESRQKYLYRSDVLTRLAERICANEADCSLDYEVSVLFCDDDRIRSLNKDYRNKDAATDVLSFGQDVGPIAGTRLLGDIVVSLETVAGRNSGDRARMRDDVRLLICHGMLHLLGYDHATAAERRDMNERQARYLGLPKDAAWRTDS